jgi:hypothetical protein
MPKASSYINETGENFVDLGWYPRAHGHPEPSKRSEWPVLPADWAVEEKVYGVLDNPPDILNGLPKGVYSYREWIKDPSKRPTVVDNRFRDAILNTRVHSHFVHVLKDVNDTAWELSSYMLGAGYSTKVQRTALKSFLYGCPHSSFSTKKEHMQPRFVLGERLRKMVYLALRVPLRG